MAEISEGTYTKTYFNVKVTLEWYIKSYTTAPAAKIYYKISLENTSDDDKRYTTDTTWASLTLDGEVTNKSYDTLTLSAGATKTLLSGTKTVYYDVAGERDISLRLAASFGTFRGSETTASLPLREQTWTGSLPWYDVRATFKSISGTMALGSKQTITISKAGESYSGTRYVDLYLVGYKTYTIASKSTATSFSYAAPLENAYLNTSGTSVDVRYCLTTYYLDSSGKYHQIDNDVYSDDVALSIPSSVVPSCNVSVADAMEYADRFGGYIFGNSKFEVTVNPTLAYNSPIQKYAITANQSSYSSNPATTDVVTKTGTNTISVTITDERGRTATASAKATVLAYTQPAVNFTVHRSNADGTDNINGSYCRVDYTAAIQSYGVENDNDRLLVLGYKKSSESDYTTVQLEMSEYSVSGTYVFEAEDSSTYDVQLIATDTFSATSRNAPLSTAFAIMHFNASGKGMAVGKLSERDAFECGLSAHFYGGMTEDLLVLQGIDFNTTLTTGRYFVLSGKNGPGGSSLAEMKAFLEVSYSEEYSVCMQQLYIITGSTSPTASSYIRFMMDETWGAWGNPTALS